MQYLTLSEEVQRNIVRLMTSHDFFLMGSGRLVYNITNTELKQCGCNLGDDYDNVDMVIKIAMGLWGITQNRHEQSIFQSRDFLPLARIFAAGDIVEVVEKVDTNAFDFLYDSDYTLGDSFEEFAYAYRYGMEKYGLENDLETTILEDEVFDTIETMRPILGNTDDLFQCGLTCDGRVVLYDYGYTSDMRSDMLKQSIDLKHMNVRDYLESLLEISSFDESGFKDLY